MNATILFEHTAPTWVAVAGALLAVAVAGWTFWRYLRAERVTWLLSALRIAFIFALGWCLLRPAMKHTAASVIRPRFLVLVDTSESMKLSPKEEIPARWTVAQEVAAQPWRKALADRAEIEVYPFADDLGDRVADITSLTPTGPATHLRESLRKLIERYRGQPLGGVLLLSDGVDARASGADLALPCPVYTVQLEPALAWEEEPDVRVVKIDTPRRVIVGWESKLTAVVSGEGTKGRVINVQLFENDQLLQEEPTQLPAEGGSREVSFQLQHPVVGNFTYTARIPPLPGEIVTNDNAYAVSVQVADTKNRLLYVEGTPRFESKFLTRALQANKSVTPLVFLQGPNKQFITIGQRGGMTTDLTAEQLAQFKIVILGDLNVEALGSTRAEAVVKFTEEGGSLVLLGGPNAWGQSGFSATPLTKLLPVRRAQFLPPREGRFAVHWTEEGKSHPAFAAYAEAWENAPPVLSIFSDCVLAPGAVALAETADHEPVIAAQRFGQGKVAAILTDSFWRWQLEPGQAGAYQKFWGQLLEWLTPSEGETQEYELDLFANAEQLFLGDEIELQARLGGAQNADVACEISTPDGRKISFPLTPQPVTTSTGKSFQGYGLRFKAQEPGLHAAVAITTINGQRVESAPFSFFLKPFSPESAPRPANVELLQALAQSSGGKFLQPAEVTDALAKLEFKGAEEERVSYATLWNSWPVLACLVALLTVEWTVRKVKNLP